MACHKVKYKSHGLAMDAARIMRETTRVKRGVKKQRGRKRERVNAYYCSVCNNWHLGT